MSSCRPRDSFISRLTQSAQACRYLTSLKNVKREGTMPSMEHSAHHLGFINYKCKFYYALYFIDEVIGNKAKIQYKSCCKKGDLTLPLLTLLPLFLQRLLIEQGPCKKEFYKHLYLYNSVFAFTSINFTRDPRLDLRYNV